MTEKIYNNFTYFKLCPNCKGDLRQYYQPVIKKFFGIKTSETYRNFFECCDCEKEVSIDLAILLAEQEQERIIIKDGTEINYNVTSDKKKIKTKTLTNYSNVIPLFIEEKLFIEILSRIIYLFNTIAGIRDIDFTKIEHLRERFENNILNEIEHLNEYTTEEIILSIYEKYKLFCYQNGETASKYVVSQGAKFVSRVNFSPNKEQEKILLELLKIKGIGELTIESYLISCYSE